jgi:hypothetical protein
MKFGVLFEWGKKSDRETFYKMAIEKFTVKQSLMKSVMRM